MRLQWNGVGNRSYRPGHASLPWEGVPLGLLPIGFVTESVLRIKRRWILLTYILTTYCGIVAIRYGAFLPGIGASLSVYGLAGLCLVAAYHSLFSVQTMAGGPIRRVLLFLVTLYVGFTVISYVAGYLLPIEPDRFLRPIHSPRLGRTAEVDAVSHLASATLPLTAWALYQRKRPRDLFR